MKKWEPKIWRAKIPHHIFRLHKCWLLASFIKCGLFSTQCILCKFTFQLVFKVAHRITKCCNEKKKQFEADSLLKSRKSYSYHSHCYEESDVTIYNMIIYDDIYIWYSKLKPNCKIKSPKIPQYTLTLWFKCKGSHFNQHWQIFQKESAIKILPTNVVTYEGTTHEWTWPESESLSSKVICRSRH